MGPAIEINFLVNRILPYRMMAYRGKIHKNDYKIKIGKGQGPKVLKWLFFNFYVPFQSNLQKTCANQLLAPD
jgi:hypothetical protein